MSDQRMDDMIDLSFNMYDENNNGVLERAEVERTMIQVFKVQGHDVSDTFVLEAIRERVDKLFAACNCVRDGYLTKEMVKRACRSNKHILHLF